MDYSVYCKTVQDASALVDQGAYDEAVTIFQSLLDSDISDLDKSLTCHNIAVVCEKMGDMEACFAWYDHGIGYEEPHLRFVVMEYKAAALVNHGRRAEALAIYETLYGLPHAMEGEKERFWNNLSILRNPRG